MSEEARDAAFEKFMLDYPDYQPQPQTAWNAAWALRSNESLTADLMDERAVSSRLRDEVIHCKRIGKNQDAEIAQLQRDKEALEADCAAKTIVLQKLNAVGGLGYEMHEAITKTLDGKLGQNLVDALTEFRAERVSLLDKLTQKDTEIERLREALEACKEVVHAACCDNTQYEDAGLHSDACIKLTQALTPPAEGQSK